MQDKLQFKFKFTCRSFALSAAECPRPTMSFAWRTMKCAECRPHRFAAARPGSRRSRSRPFFPLCFLFSKKLLSVPVIFEREEEIKMMRAISVTKLGGPEVLQIAQVPKPTPKSGNQKYENVHYCRLIGLIRRAAGPECIRRRQFHRHLSSYRAVSDAVAVYTGPVIIFSVIFM